MDAKMVIRSLPVGPLQANCHILACKDTRKAAVIDPGGDTDKILLALAKDQLTLIAIINTHGHFDHVAGNQALKSATGAEIMIHALDAPLLEAASQSAAQWGLRVASSPQPDRLLKDGDTITIGNITLTVLHTPGHTPGGICLLTEKTVFVGDTLFPVPSAERISPAAITTP